MTNDVGMTTVPKKTRATIISSIRYREAARMIDWLCGTLGFEKHSVFEGKDGRIEHSELSYGNGMIMVSSISDTEFAKHMKQPDEIGGAETQSLYLIVSDADAVYAKATAAGAEMLIDIKDESWGGRGFSCRDPEGHIWSIGTYDPWEAKPI